MEIPSSPRKPPHSTCKNSSILEEMPTGRYSHYFMMVQNKHKLQRNTLVYDLLIENGRCYGVKALVNYKHQTIYADDIIIAMVELVLYMNSIQFQNSLTDIHGYMCRKRDRT